VDNVHAIVAKKIEEKVNVLVWGPFEKWLIRKRFNVLGNEISKFFCQRFFLKWWWVAKRFFVKCWPSYCEKSIAIAIYGKSLVHVFNFTSMSSSYFPF
jgi:hypothetical protein